MRDALSRITNRLPDGVEAPTIVKADSNASAIMQLSVTSDSMPKGELSAHRAAFHETMRAVIDRAIDGHYRAPFALLDLGFILKKAVAMGDDAIRGGAMRTISTAIQEADEATLAHLAKFLEVRVLR